MKAKKLYPSRKPLRMRKGGTTRSRGRKDLTPEQIREMNKTPAQKAEEARVAQEVQDQKDRDLVADVYDPGLELWFEPEESRRGSRIRRRRAKRRLRKAQSGLTVAQARQIAAGYAGRK